MLSEEKVLKTVKLLQKYHQIANTPNADNDVEIINDCIYLIENGEVVIERKLNVDDLKLKISHIEYGDNFNSCDVRYSPLEADRKNKRNLWKYSYNKINFPRFLSIALFSLLATGDIPDICDFCNIFILTYTEEIPYGEEVDLSKYLNHKHSYTSLNKELHFNDGRITHNKLLRFKEEYLAYVSGLPFNEFTTEQICNRISKAYGSIIRDIYNVLRFNKFGVDTYYSLYTDLKGIDGIIDHVPICSFTNTFAGDEFRDKKVNNRHPELKDEASIALKKDVLFDKNDKGIHIISDDKIKEIIRKIKQDKIKSVVEMIY